MTGHALPDMTLMVIGSAFVLSRCMSDMANNSYLICLFIAWLLVATYPAPSVFLTVLVVLYGEYELGIEAEAAE